MFQVMDVPKRVRVPIGTILLVIAIGLLLYLIFHTENGPITHRTIESTIERTEIAALAGSLLAWQSRKADSTVALDSVKILGADSVEIMIHFGLPPGK